MVSYLQHNGVRASVATVVLLVLGAVIAPSTMQPSAIVGLLPFAAILSIAAVGQHVVIQQKGLDISVAGVFSFAAVIVTAMQSGNAGIGESFGLISLALLAGLAFGTLNGVAVTVLHLPPLVVTIAMNSIAFGLVLWLSGGVASSVAAPIGSFSLGRTLGLPNPVIVALILVCLSAFLLAKTTLGRRFLVAGISPTAGAALGFRVRALQIGAYSAAGTLFAASGVLFAGLSDVPSLFAGNDYMLASVAAYIVGGNSIAGDRGSILATAIGALFLTFLGQLVIALGFDTSTQYVIQAFIVLLGVGVPSLVQRFQWTR